ncbi:hypothetical protein TRIUR3_09858 [Triticum urartu]|uniref:Uncharacterized protein n=1 Tax=Triticum urartu TaxID=4572 RepID=M7Z8W2_TRIUA|nr:hypothetical protein TRIUR3_09858 [Triticum urartu]
MNFVSLIELMQRILVHRSFSTILLTLTTQMRVQFDCHLIFLQVCFAATKIFKILNSYTAMGHLANGGWADYSVYVGVDGAESFNPVSVISCTLHAEKYHTWKNSHGESVCVHSHILHEALIFPPFLATKDQYYLVSIC